MIKKPLKHKKIFIVLILLFFSLPIYGSKIRSLLIQKNFINWQHRGETIKKITGKEKQIAFLVRIGNTKNGEHFRITLLEGSLPIFDETFSTPGHKNDVLWFRSPIKKIKNVEYKLIVQSKTEKKEFKIPIFLSKKTKPLENKKEMEKEKKKKSKPEIKKETKSVAVKTYPNTLPEIAQLLDKDKLDECQTALLSYYKGKKNERYRLLILALTMKYIENYQFKDAQFVLSKVKLFFRNDKKITSLYKALENREKNGIKSDIEPIKKYYLLKKALQEKNIDKIINIFKNDKKLFNLFSTKFIETIYSKETISYYKKIALFLKERNKKDAGDYLSFVLKKAPDKKDEILNFAKKEKIPVKNHTNFPFLTLIIILFIIILGYLLIKFFKSFSPDYLQKGLEFYKNNDYENAALFLEKYIAKNKENVDVMVLRKLAEIYMKTDRLEDAVKMYKKCDAMILDDIKRIKSDTKN